MQHAGIRAPVLSVHRTRSGIHLVAPSLPRVLSDALYTTEVHWECCTLTFRICEIEMVLERHHQALLEPLLGAGTGSILVSDPGLLWKMKGTMVTCS